MKKMKNTTPKRLTNNNNSRLKTDHLRDDLLTPRKFLILYSKVIFDGSYKKANKWLEYNGLKIKKDKYYENLRNLKQRAYHRLSLLAQDYPQILDEELRKQDLHIHIRRTVTKKN